MTSKTTNKFSPEVRERAVRMVGEHRVDYGSEWAALGCHNQRHWRDAARAPLAIIDGIISCTDIIGHHPLTFPSILAVALAAGASMRP